ncbi:MAG: TM0106 family RecB-like putative nuclease [Haloechinothrix sp.]
MQLDGTRLVLSPTDLTKHLACPHVTSLDLQVALGARPRPKTDDEALELIFRLGLEHEAAYLEQLRTEGRTIAEMETVFGDDARRAAEARTLDAMRSGVDVVYQATLYDGQWGGQADFLLKVDRPSELGDWCYEIADTKLARRLKVPALLQMATYAERLAVLQGVEPDRVYVVTGDGVSRPWRLVDVGAYARRARHRLRTAVTERPATEPVPVTHCAQCRWADHCQALWRRQDDLSLVAFMRGDHRARLHELGIRTVDELAGAAPAALSGIGSSSRERLVRQAALQIKERATGTAHYELLDPQPKLGLLRLPPPSPGDVYLDFEGDPYADGGEGREYLAGLGDRRSGFTALWAHDGAAERQLVVDLVDDLTARWRQDPGMHVYHYAPYETTALKRMTARHGVREAELDQLLRAERFVDLYAVVRQGLRISKPSYSIKKMEAFYWGEIRGAGDVADAMSSVLAYERWLVEPDDTTLRQIEDYNADDVRSTHDLHCWLEQRRTELESQHGPQLRPHEQPRDPETPPTDQELAEHALAERLHAVGHSLLADLVQWHRREMRPQWWEVFRLEDLEGDELVDDGSAIGELSAPVHVGDIKKSKLWRYEFPPQDCKLGVGRQALDVDEHATAGEVHELDPVAGYIVLKLGAKREPLTPRGFGPPGPVDDKPLREAVRRLGESIVNGGHSLGRALLERRTPPETPLRDGESPHDAVLRLGRRLNGEVLAVQGPPGSGKTTVGAALIRALLDDGKRVGVVAQSHAVIGHLLSAVRRPALQKRTKPEDFCGAPGVEETTDNNVVVQRLADGTATLVGGTAWLWSRPDLAEAVDVLVVDEAGQFSLANALAVAQSARSMVLLGDPQQLAQPSQGVHPDGAGASVLEHLLDGNDTVPPDHGVFLGTTWRMHPEIAEFVSALSYEGRLEAGPGRERQRVEADQGISGSGLRFVPVAHEGCAAASDAEAAVVRRLLADLQGASWLDHEGARHPLGRNDVLVVAPYNNHVGRLKASLPEGARIGTVDKFQGQEAPVVIYTMASSSVEDAPRGIDFLYDIHRLNVAVSRARCLAVVVANPRLLDAAVHSPEQLRKVNALCRFTESARG